MVTRPLLLAPLVALAAACAPTFDDRAASIDGPRLLAISSTPAEAAPMSAVSFTALYVDEKGERAGKDLAWAFCIDRKPLTDEGTVSPLCTAASGAGLVQLGDGLTSGGALPADGCELFGPNRPTPVGDQPGGRAVDPDASGGFYQPVRLRIDGPEVQTPITAIGATRIDCGVDGATPEVAAELTERYRLNENPAVTAFHVLRGSASTAVAIGEAIHVKAGEKVTLRAGYPACPTTSQCGDGVCGVDETAEHCPSDCTTPKGCQGAEQYAWYDPETRAVKLRREAVRVAWFSTGGSLASDTTGHTEAEADETSVDNDFTAPKDAGAYHLWLVSRDDRGGVGFVGFELIVD